MALATVGTTLLGAAANTGAFRILGMLTNNKEEIKRHNMALERQSQARDEFNKARARRLDFINKTIRQHTNAEETFHDLDAMQ